MTRRDLEKNWARALELLARARARHRGQSRAYAAARKATTRLLRAEMRRARR